MACVLLLFLLFVSVAISVSVFPLTPPHIMSFICLAVTFRKVGPVASVRYYVYHQKVFWTVCRIV